MWASLPLVAAAAGLVPCGESSTVGVGAGQSLSCDICYLGQLVQNLINWLLGISVPIAAAMFAWAGILYFSSRGVPAQIERAHKIFRSVVIGFVIAIAAWSVVQLVVTTLFNPKIFSGGGGSWNSLNCGVTRDARRNTVNQTLNSVLGPMPVVGSINSEGIVTAPSGDQVDLSERLGKGGICPKDYLYTDDEGDLSTAMCHNPNNEHEVKPEPLNGKVAGDNLVQVNAAAQNGNAEAFGFTTTRSDGNLLATYESVRSRYGAQIDEACESYGANVPNCSVAMATLISNESSGIAGARSKAGAIGLTQVLPGNALNGCDIYNDIACNINSGVSYLNKACTTFNQNLPNCYAAYNGGVSETPGTSPTGKTPAMAPSRDCPQFYAYQCNINPGGLTETQHYVANNCRLLKLNGLRC